MSEKLLKRASGENFPLTGMMLGEIPVDEYMLNAWAVNSLINTAVAAGWRAGGSKTATDLSATGESSLLKGENDGKVYNISEDFTTTADFVEGAGFTYMAGTNVAVINTAKDGQPAVYKFDVLGGTDQSVVRQINLVGSTQALLPTAGTVEIPAALSAAYGVVRLDDTISSDSGLTSGYAATPSAVKAALLSAKNYADSIKDTYELSGYLDENRIDYIVDLTRKTADGTPLSSFKARISAATSNYPGIVKLSDGALSGLDASQATAATPKAVYDALGSAYRYTDSAISALDYSLTAIATSQTITSLTQTDGKISAQTADIAIGHGQVTDWDAATKATIYTVLSANGLTTDAQPTTLNETIALLMKVVNNIKALSATA